MYVCMYVCMYVYFIERMNECMQVSIFEGDYERLTCVF